VCIDYARVVDIIRLRIHTIRSALCAEADAEKMVQEYLCVTPSCAGTRYTSLDAARIINPATGTFHCEECGGALALDVGQGEAGDDEAARRKRDESRMLLSRFDAAVKPIEDALARAKASGADPPDYGSLQDWVAMRAAAARDEMKRSRPGYKGPARDRRNGTFDFLEDTEFEVQLEGAGGAGGEGGAGGGGGGGGAGGAGGAAAPARGRKVVPPWMVRQGMAARAAEAEAPARAAADVYAAEYVRQYQAYLQSMQAAAAAAAAGGGAAAGAAGGAGEDEQAAAKRQRTEAPGGAAGGAAAAEAEGGDVEWEDADGGEGGEGGEGEEEDWEEV
jgi:hypothetical protein